MKFYGRVMMAVTEMVVDTLVFLWVGQALDKHFQTKILVILGAVLGFCLGIAMMIIRFNRIMKDEDAPGGKGP